MKTLVVNFIVFFAFFGMSQTPFKTIASNRIIQNHQPQSNLKKIQDADPARLEALWKYFTQSFQFSDVEEPNLSIDKLLNIYHFDITQYEQMRQLNDVNTFTFRGSIEISLISQNSLQNLIAGYNLDSLVNSIPMRAFPIWNATDVTQQTFQEYKNRVWEWAKDFPEEYLIYTNNPAVKHIPFPEFVNMGESKRSTLLNQSLIILID